MNTNGDVHLHRHDDDGTDRHESTTGTATSSSSSPSPSPPSLSSFVHESHSSLADLMKLRDKKRLEYQDMFAQQQTLRRQLQKIQSGMQTLDGQLIVLDKEIDDLEEQEDQQQIHERELFQQHQEQKQQQTQSSIQMPLPLDGNDSLTSPHGHQPASQPRKTAPLSVDSNHVTIDEGDDTGPDDNDLNHINNILGMNPATNTRRQSAGVAIATTRRTTSTPSASTTTLDQFGITPRNNKVCPYPVQKITDTLQNTFRIQSFRPLQLEVIQTTLSGQDALVILRTGGGKSLTYQLPVVLERPKITVVISPLISLIQDQVEQMNQFVPGSCVAFTSGLGTSLHAQQWKRVRNGGTGKGGDDDDGGGGVGMIMITPEKLHKSGKMKNELEQLNVQGRLARFVVDECHCACQWGHDFRPDYAKLGILKHHFPKVPILALTATASEKVQDEVCTLLKLKHPKKFQASVNRPNLKYAVYCKDSPNQVLHAMVEYMRTLPVSAAGIVYTYSRKDADTVADQLCEQGIIAEAYHSDVNATQKIAIHQRWMQNETQVVVATIAFGLGINKPDVRFVLHHTLSKTLEAYYQESGRAGRDGKPADCILYYSPKDVPRMIRMIHGESAEPHFWKMVKYGQLFGNDTICRALLLDTLEGKQQRKDSNLFQQFAYASTTNNNNNDTNMALQQLLDDVQNYNPDVVNIQPRDVTSHVRTVLELLFLKQDENITLSMLVKEWRAKPATAPECVQNNPPGKDLSVAECEYIIIQLLIDELITINVKWTAYDSVVYLRCTHNAQDFLVDPNVTRQYRFPKKQSGTGRAGTSSSSRRKRSPGTAGVWINPSTGRENKAAAAAKKPAAASKAKKKTTTKRKRTSTTKKSTAATKKGTVAKKKKAAATAVASATKKRKSTATATPATKRTKTKTTAPTTKAKKTPPASASGTSTNTSIAMPNLSRQLSITSAQKTSQPEIIELDDDDEDPFVAKATSKNDAFSVASLEESSISEVDIIGDDDDDDDDVNYDKNGKEKGNGKTTMKGKKDKDVLDFARQTSRARLTRRCTQKVTSPSISASGTATTTTKPSKYSISENDNDDVLWDDDSENEF